MPVTSSETLSGLFVCLFVRWSIEWLLARKVGKWVVYLSSFCIFQLARCRHYIFIYHLVEQICQSGANPGNMETAAVVIRGRSAESSLLGRSWEIKFKMIFELAVRCIAVRCSEREKAETKYILCEPRSN